MVTDHRRADPFGDHRRLAVAKEHADLAGGLVAPRTDPAEPVAGGDRPPHRDCASVDVDPTGQRVAAPVQVTRVTERRSTKHRGRTLRGEWAAACHGRADESEALAGVHLRIHSLLEQQDDVGTAELEVAKLLALCHLLAHDRGEDHRSHLSHAHRDYGDDADVAPLGAGRVD